MATRNTSNAVLSSASGALPAVLSDSNALTFTGAVLGAATLGGAAFVGAVVAPAQVVGYGLAAGTLLAAGAVKDEKGSVLFFLDNEEARTKNQARADKRRAAREAKANAVA